MRPRRWLVGGAIVAVVVLSVVLFRAAIIGGVLGLGAGALGYQLGYAGLNFDAGRFVIDHLDLRSKAGEPVLAADLVAVSYDLREVFGSPHPFGLTGIEIDRPRLTYIKHRDGSSNITLPASNGSSQANGPRTIPQITFALHDGAIGIRDDSRIFAHSRRIAVEKIHVDANLNPTQISKIALGLTIQDADGTFPITGAGTLDPKRGIELTRIAAKTVGLSALLDYALNSASVHIAGGVLNDIDARVYGLRAQDGSMERHASVSANLDHFQPYIGGVTKPLRDGRGSLLLSDRGLEIPRVDGSIADVPIRLTGGVYDLSAPKLRIGITGNGDLRNLVTLSDAAKKFPVTGPIAFKIFVEGAATQPLTFVSFDSPHLSYGKIPLSNAGGLLAIHGQDAAIVRSSVSYDGSTAGARGALTLGKHTGVELVASVSALANRFPYAADILGAMPIVATAAVNGVDANLKTVGVLSGDTRTTHLAGTFGVDATGVGDIGPITIDGPGNRSAYMRVALDRPRGGGGAGFVSLQNVRIATGGAEPTLPGLFSGNAPRISGTLAGNIAGAINGSNVLAAGDLHAYGVSALGYPVDDLTANGNVLASTAHPNNARIAADLRYRGSLAPIARAAGGSFKATGSVDIPVTIAAIGTSSLLAQIAGARFRDASIAGVPLTSLQGTVGLRGRTIDVYGAQAGIGGGNVVARGSFGNGGTLAVSTSALDLAALRSAGLPVRSGTLAALASIDGTTDAPHVVAGVAASDVVLTNPQAASLTIDANTGLSYAGGTLGVSNTTVAAGPALAALDGHVTGLRGNPTNARYDFSAHVRQADIQKLAQLAPAARKLAPEGSLDADVRVRGVGSAANILGAIAIPDGSINGLRYRDARVALRGTASDVHADAGTVTVGTSTLGFGAVIAAGSQTFALHAPKVDLSDFNDFFDPGDLLGGTGSIDVAVANAPDRLATSGRVRIRHARAKRFDLGPIAADWSTTGRTIRTNASIGDTAGRVTESGDVTLAATAPLRDTLHRSNLAISTRAQNVDLNVWLPAAGIQAPVLGLINADGSVRGAYPNLVANAHADLQHGLVQRIPIRTASIDATARNGQATIANAVLAIDNLQANAHGTATLSPGGPFDVTLDARTADIAALDKTLTGKTIDAAGAIDTSIRVSGTQRKPAVSGVLDATSVRYAKYTIPHAHAQLAVVPGRATISNTEVDLQKGKVLIDGFAPLQANFAGVLPTSPLALNVTASGIDLSQFEAFAPKNTVITGAIDGRVGLVGDLEHPGLSGTLALVKGSFVGPQLKSKVSDLDVRIALADRTVTLQRAAAKIGGGTIAATGTLTVPNLNDPVDSLSLAFSLDTNNAVFDLPGTFKGRLNGNVSIARAAFADYKVVGQIGVTSARLNPTGFLSKAPAPTSSATPLPVDIALGIDVGNDVRVQGGPVDIGAKGDLNVGGTAGAPTVDGILTSTGGTLSFYRTFRMQYPSTVSFYPSNGVIPDIDATATTEVDNPTTDITLHVTGPATQLNVDLQSDPSYDRAQILGLLIGVQALGAVSGVSPSGQPGAQANPYTALAQGQLGNLLTQNVLEPFSSQLGSAVGLNNLEVNYQPGGALGLGAQKQIAKNVDAVYAQSFNYPARQSIGLRATPKPSTAYQFTVFSQPDSSRLQTLQANDFLSTNQSVTSSEPSQGTSGFSASFQRKFH